MNYEKAWKEIVKISKVIKDSNYTEDVTGLILCIEYLQWKIKEEEKSNPKPA